ncbi:MAG TPA: TldD/PmbA family protein [Dehalococcoidia bacterium]|nr:TldD/PmbA family protein [Dehalococcoidia bacterium]
MLGEPEVRRIVAEVLAASRADQTEVAVFSSASALTRFANNYIHQNVEYTDVDVRVRAVLGQKIGIASTNEVSADALARVAARAVELARHQRENEDFRSLVRPAPVAAVESFVEPTARCGPEERASVVAQICDASSRAGLTAAGAFQTSAQAYAIANSLGVFALHRETQADINTVIMSETSSGHAARVSKDVSDIDGEAVAAEAVDKALRGVAPKAIEPGTYEVILEPYAVVDLLDFFSYLSFGALPFMEKRSFMSGRLGERVMGENISIWDDGLSPQGLPMAFDYEGVPKRRVDFVEGGVAREVCWDSYYAGKQGGDTRSTGHALPAGNTIGPLPLHMFMAPGDATRDEMVRATRRGLWVSRFWYTRTVHPLNVVVTGMTRDGTFLIEDGKIVGPVRNMRFTQGYVEALGHVDLVGRDTMLVLGDLAGGVRRVPALKIAAWEFTGVSEA